jgi:hypothetical protein
MKRRFDWRLPVLAVVAIILLACAWNWSAWRDRAWIAAGFGARIACSCRHVEGRPIESCRTDFARLTGMGLVHLSDSPQAPGSTGTASTGKGVDASVPLLAHRTARLVPGFGCVMQDR